MLEGKASPSMVERTLIRPPSARLGPRHPAGRAPGGDRRQPSRRKIRPRRRSRRGLRRPSGRTPRSGPASDEEWAGEFRIPKKPGASELPPPPPRKESGKRAAAAARLTRKPSASRLRGRSARPQAGSSIAFSGQRSSASPDKKAFFYRLPPPSGRALDIGAETA